MPILASDVATLAEWIRDGEDGLLFETGSPDALVGRIEQLAAHRHLIGELGRRAPRIRPIGEAADDYERSYRTARAVSGQETLTTATRPSRRAA